MWPLIELAIRDKRLLVFVDGLDEWVSEEAGRAAVQRLLWFVEGNDLQAVVVSRPYGFERLGLSGASWQVSELAPLTQEQRYALCVKWLSIWDKRESGTATKASSALVVESYAEKQSTEFIAELDASKNLSDLSFIPLLLLLLLCLHIEGAALPRNRFQAYEYLIDHLVREHPARKRVASATTELSSMLTDDELRSALGFIAFWAHHNWPMGPFPEADVRGALSGFLNEHMLGPGLSEKEANQLLGRFFKFEEGSVGLLISPFIGQFNFLHRSLQEFLAGAYMSQLGLVEQSEIFRSRAADPRWKDVLLAALWQVRRPEDVDRLVERIEISGEYRPDNFIKRELLAEISCGDFKITVSRARETVAKICNEIESNPWLPRSLPFT